MTTDPSVLDAITPEAIALAVRKLVSDRGQTARSAVAIGVLARQLVADGVLLVDLGDGRVAAQVYRHIAKTVRGVEGLTFIENE